jgi:hypothetical protein
VGEDGKLTRRGDGEAEGGAEGEGGGVSEEGEEDVYEYV